MIEGISAEGAPPPRPGWKTGAGLTLLVVLLGAHALYFDYLTDDAFITFRYVRNLLEGHGLVYNPGERVEGYTNFLWAMLLALPSALGASPEKASRALGLLLGAGTVVLTWRIARRLRQSSGTGTDALLDFLPPALVAANGSFALWAGAGLEAPLFAFLLALLISTYLEARRATAFYACGAWLALLTMTRPDGVFFAAAMGAHLLVLGAAGGAPGGPGRGDRWRAPARLVAAFLALYLPYFLWRSTYYGYLLPNSFYAKVGGFGPAVLRGSAYAWSYLRNYGAVPALAAGVALAARLAKAGAASQAAPRRTGTSLLWFLLIGYAVFIALAGGDHLVMFRFVAPIVPLIALLAGAGFRWAASRWSAPPRTRSLAAAALVVTCVAVTALPSFISGESRQVFADEKPAEADRKVIGEWLRANVPAGTSIAVIPAGIVPYYSRLPTIDLLGLNDLTIAHTEVASLGAGQAGHEKHNSRYVLERRPGLIFLGACRIWPERMSLPNLLRYYRWYEWLVPGNEEMLAMRELPRNYEACAARAGSGYVHFLKRRDLVLPAAEPLALPPRGEPPPDETAPGRRSQ